MNSLNPELTCHVQWVWGVYNGMYGSAGTMYT